MRFRRYAMAIAALGVIASAVAYRVAKGPSEGIGIRHRGPAAVEVGVTRAGPIELRRTFSGTLEAPARVVVSSDVGGRVRKLFVQLADPIRNGQLVAELEDDEEVQGVSEARAELAVVRANIAEADSALEISRRNLARIEELRTKGLVSEADVDKARADINARKSAAVVARASQRRAAAALERAKIRSRYTRVHATWTGDESARVVAVRHVNEGDTIRVGDPIFTIVALEPMVAVIHVGERDYGLLAAGQAVTVTTEGYPDRTFSGHIARIAPEFRESSRQARVEIEIDNHDHDLRPGMFVHAEVVLRHVEETTSVPVAAITQRNGQTGVFVVTEDEHVDWVPVTTGIRQGDWIEVHGDGVTGRVVTLGQQLIADGSAIVIPDPDSKPLADGS